MKGLMTIPRITGIVLIILAALAYQTHGTLRSGLLGIAGLTLLLSRTKTAQKHWQDFLETFKLKKEFAMVMLFDVIFWALLAVLAMIMAAVMRRPYEQIKAMQLGGEMTIANIDAYNSIIQHFFASAITAIIIFWILIVAAYTLSRGLIWMALLGKKGSASLFFRMFLLNLAWCTAWLALTLFLMSTLVQPFGAYAFIIMMILYAHLTTALHYSYIKSPRFADTIRSAFGKGLGRISKFVQPYCYIFIVYVILQQAQRLATSTTALVISFIVFLAFMAWYRKYLRDVLRHA